MIRSWARNMTEPHPFARNPVSVKPYPAQYSVMFRKLGRTSMVFFPCVPVERKREVIRNLDAGEVKELILNMRWDD
ncbi:hypothetical protein SLS59_007561 [Nothophoma quercina]|uniref:Uncharacterized protein n=1 Tax=Nothophoma quercina TaxID=749835 RepID=A0ABR3QXD5_9PLEO